MNLCELIRAAHSGNLSGSRVSCLGVVPLHLGHSFDVAAQSPQELLADIHTGLPGHHLESSHGSHPLVAEVLQSWVPDVGDLGPDPAGHHCDWGKRHTTRVNLQVVCTLAGHIAWISKP